MKTRWVRCSSSAPSISTARDSIDTDRHGFVPHPHVVMSMRMRCDAIADCHQRPRKTDGRGVRRRDRDRVPPGSGRASDLGLSSARDGGRHPELCFASYSAATVCYLGPDAKAGLQTRCALSSRSLDWLAGQESGGIRRSRCDVAALRCAAPSRAALEADDPRNANLTRRAQRSGISPTRRKCGVRQIRDALDQTGGALWERLSRSFPAKPKSVPWCCRTITKRQCRHASQYRLDEPS